MQTENFVFHHSCERQQIEQLGEVFPHVCITIFPLALVIKAIDLRDLSALMIPSQDCDPVSIPHFEGYQQSHCFHTVVASVYVVSHKKVVSIRAIASNLEKFNKVMELSMYVSANCDWAFDRLDILLIL